jgi:hypothetical protein
MKNLNFVIIFAFLLFAMSTIDLNAQNRNNNHSNNGIGKNNGNAGSWRILGTLHAKHTADHDALTIAGPHDYYRKLKFKVTDSPVNIQRMVVRYDDGAPENINTRCEIPKGGESRVIDLKGGKRKLKSIEFWYDTTGFLNGKADVTVLGMK